MSTRAQKLVLATLSVLTLVALSVAGILYQKVCSFNAKHHCDVLAGLSSAELPAESPTKHVETPAETPCAEETPAPETADRKLQLAVDHVEYDGERELQVVFTERPDMDVVRNYVKVAPMAAGAVGFRYHARFNDSGDCEPVIHITGEFAYRTNVTLRILKGFPLYGKGANPTAEGSLAQDFVFTFVRRDPKPSVAFADDGRYLPPGGRNALRIEAISVTNVATEIWRVEPRNLVQLLAREERQYSRSSWWSSTADDADTAELSGACETGRIACVNRPCEKEVCLFPLAMKDEGPERGVFLVAVRNGDRPRDEDSYRNSKYNPNLFRLVCLSDLGLSVRDGKNGLGVWVTSLTSGLPLKDVHIEVYSSANILLAEGESGADGWCAPRRRTKGEPFAVVAWTASDMTFLALRESMKVDETHPDGARAPYLSGAELDAFVWTERGIYRHGERIFVQALARDCQLKAPKPLPIKLVLRNPKGDVWTTATRMTDAEGSLTYAGFAVGDEQPSGKWTVQVCLPGEDGKVLAEREIKIEEFAPPQVRVKVTSPESPNPTNFAFTITAEHLFGGPASSLSCEGAVVFEDVPFAPAKWKGFTFGNDQLGLKPCFRRMSQRVLDAHGVCAYEAPLWADSGRPKAAVRATGQGIVFEDGGRPATARKSIICHYYPYYIGSNLPSWLKCPKTGAPKIGFVCVDPQGAIWPGARKLVGKIDRIDSVYSYRKSNNGQSTWDCERVRTTIFDSVAITVDDKGCAEYELPMTACGDYVLTVEDPATGVSFGRAFYLSDWGDDVVRAPLSNPTEVTLRPDKAYYRVGESPRLVVKSPFAGYALLSVMRDELIYDEIVNLTNATSEIVLRPLERVWAPNLDVAISVVQSVQANARHLAARAHGQTTVRIRPAENELAVRLAAEVAMKGEGEAESGSRVTVAVTAPGATSAVVTLVDEGINLLTGEPVPDPIERLTRVRAAEHPLFDLFSRVLPVADGGLKASGIKTGGGFGAEMLGRVSPVATRRFKPLARWQEKVAIRDGSGRAVFDLPEFVGEVRVTAVAYSAAATGSASLRKKVTPRLVLQPDAPRFVAPEDEFQVTLPLRNTDAKAGSVHYEIRLDETGEKVHAGQVVLPAGGSTNVCAWLKALRSPGEMSLTFKGVGLGETHQATLRVPVRAAVASRQVAGVAALKPGAAWQLAAEGDAARFGFALGDMPFAGLAHALAWLAEYPHGCLEQTVSRIFPLVTGRGILAAYAPAAITNRRDYVAAGVRRVESMVRETDFVVWPDSNCAPWDREVSLYAAHFLIEAEKVGQKLNPQVKARVLKFLRKWALDEDVDVSAYACHTLALVGQPEKDRLFRLYDAGGKLSALARARLSRAFVAISDRGRAEALLNAVLEPQSVKEAAFLVLALMDLDPEDARIPRLVTYLESRRDRERFSWGTTSENAHALLAMGSYLSHQGKTADGAPHLRYAFVDRGVESTDQALTNGGARVLSAKSVSFVNDGSAPGFLSWRRIEWPSAQTVTNEANGIFISRRYRRSDGTPADLAKLVRGEMLIAELTVTSAVTRVVSDLVIEDLFAGAFEPVQRELDPSAFLKDDTQRIVEDWILRLDARDDRMLVFSTAFRLEAGYEAKVFYPVRVVSAGDFVLPGPSVEGMYHSELHARRAPDRIVVRP